jgi:hypothetical protein
VIPAAVRDEIDDFVRHRRHLQAIRVLWEQHGYRLNDATDIAAMRFEELHGQGEG